MLHKCVTVTRAVAVLGMARMRDRQTDMFACVTDTQVCQVGLCEVLRCTPYALGVHDMSLLWSPVAHTARRRSLVQSA